MEKRTVLFVDDDEKLLACLARVVATEPYGVLFANSGQKAVETLAREQVHAIVTDMHMPEMGGLELLKTVKQQYPQVIRLVLSGDDEAATLLGAINQGEIFRFIPKPWKSSEELRTTIRQAIEFYDLHSEREMLMHFFELWVEGLEPDSVDIQFLRALIASRKKHVYQWNRRYRSVAVKPG